MKTILITGGTGLVGKRLIEHLVKKNYNVIVLTRNIQNIAPSYKVQYALWNVKEGTIDITAIKKADAIIHLAGAGVMDKKWTTEYKKEIEESRTLSSKILVDTLTNNEHKVKVLLSASAIGWYGADKLPNHFFEETEPADTEFLGIVCQKWEQAITKAEALGIRVCKLRTGIVLSKEGGAYKEFKTPTKFGIAPILGNGKQIISWIHIDDLCNQYLHLLQNENTSGSYNAVAPEPVSNKTLTITIAKKNKFYVPFYVPTFVLKIMLGTRCVEILKSARVSASKILQSGFAFNYPSIIAAVDDIEAHKN